MPQSKTYNRSDEGSAEVAVVAIAIPNSNANHVEWTLYFVTA